MRDTSPPPPGTMAALCEENALPLLSAANARRRGVFLPYTFERMLPVVASRLLLLERENLLPLFSFWRNRIRMTRAFFSPFSPFLPRVAHMRDFPSPPSRPDVCSLSGIITWSTSPPFSPRPGDRVARVFSPWGGWRWIFFSASPPVLPGPRFSYTRPPGESFFL